VITPERSSVVRFHFLAFYSEGIEPLPAGKPEPPRQIGHTIELKPRPEYDLAGEMLRAVDADPAINEHVKYALHTGQFRFYPLADGVSSENWSGEPGQQETILWQIDPYWQTVSKVSAMYHGGTLSLRGLDELVDLGYVGGNPRELLVLIDWGLGGGEGFNDLAAWLFQHGVDIGIGYVGEQIFGRAVSWIASRFRGSRRDRRARLLASLWERNNFFRPADLREFVEFREEWDLAEFGKRLALKPPSARQLLRSLGYEQNRAGGWERSDHWRSRRRLREWLRDEADQTSFAEFFPEPPSPPAVG